MKVRLQLPSHMHTIHCRSGQTLMVNEDWQIEVERLSEDYFDLLKLDSSIREFADGASVAEIEAAMVDDSKVKVKKRR